MGWFSWPPTGVMDSRTPNVVSKEKYKVFNATEIASKTEKLYDGAGTRETSKYQ